MLKKILLFLLIAAGYLLIANPAGAEESFIVDSNVTYDVAETGKTLVTHEVTLENAFSTLYATSYTLSLENIEAGNVKTSTADGRQLTAETQKEGDKTNIKITFGDAVVGRGKSRHFFVTYENSNFAVRTGEIWEISIPKLSTDSSFRNYQAILKVPVKFGLEAYVSPRPVSSETVDNFRVYTFAKEDLVKTGVTAGFGEFQVFTYTLNYHLENPLSRSAETEIALPPDTAYQKVYIRSLNPEPVGIRIDADGNWLATYKLSPRQRIDVAAAGEVQIFASFRHFPPPSDANLQKNLQSTDYWQSSDPKIKELADKLKTPKAIYDYVSSNLKYDYERVKPNVERLGAVNALARPNEAICMEFTDLFIAIARSAGIAAREINGYAYTENPKIQPLSLVADVLHSWPEYWDEDRHVWVPVDPTWASTTGGVNFFDKLDLRHFTFVIHGEDSTKPYAPGSYKLGANPQKDVFVSFGKLSSDISQYPKIDASFKPALPFFSSRLDIKISNTGPAAFYSLYPEVFFDKAKHLRDFVEVLPPFAAYEMQVKVPYSLLGKDTPAIIRVQVDGTALEVPTNKNRVIISSLLTLLTLFTILILIIMIRVKWKKQFSNAFLKAREFIFSNPAKSPSTSEKP